MHLRLARVLSVGAAFALAGALPAVAQRGATPAGSDAAASPAEPAPRSSDGHVNLGSTKDKKGYWEVRPGLGGFPRAADVPFQPWAKAMSDYRNSRPDLYPPLVQCKAAGGP